MLAKASGAARGLRSRVARKAAEDRNGNDDVGAGGSWASGHAVSSSLECCAGGCHDADWCQLARMQRARDVNCPRGIFECLTNESVRARRHGGHGIALCDLLALTWERWCEWAPGSMLGLLSGVAVGAAHAKWAAIASARPSNACASFRPAQSKFRGCLCAPPERRGVVEDGRKTQAIKRRSSRGPPAIRFSGHVPQLN